MDSGRINKITPNDPDCPVAAPCPLTSDKINVNSFTIEVAGADQTDTIQPRVTIFLEIEGKEVVGQPVRVRIQTSVSQRSLDILE